MRIRNPPKFIMNISFIMKVIMTFIVFQCSAGEMSMTILTEGKYLRTER